MSGCDRAANTRLAPGLRKVKQRALRGKRLVLRFVATQIACAAAVALACAVASGWNAARSALAGGLIVATGTLIFGWRLFAADWPPANVAQGFFLGELLKWLWIGGAFWFAFTVGGFVALALLAGALAAQVGFWVAVGAVK